SETKTTNLPSGDISAPLSSPGKSVKRVTTGFAKKSAGAEFLVANQIAPPVARTNSIAVQIHALRRVGTAAGVMVRNAALPVVVVPCKRRRSTAKSAAL